MLLTINGNYIFRMKFFLSFLFLKLIKTISTTGQVFYHSGSTTGPGEPQAQVRNSVCVWSMHLGKTGIWLAECIRE